MTKRRRTGTPPREAGQTAIEIAVTGGIVFAVLLVAVLVVLPRLGLTGTKKRDLSATELAYVQAVATQQAHAYIDAVATQQASDPSRAESPPSDASHPISGFVVTSDGHEGALVALGFVLFIIVGLAAGSWAVAGAGD